MTIGMSIVAVLALTALVLEYWRAVETNRIRGKLIGLKSEMLLRAASDESLHRSEGWQKLYHLLYHTEKTLDGLRIWVLLLALWLMYRNGELVNGNEGSEVPEEIKDIESQAFGFMGLHILVRNPFASLAFVAGVIFFLGGRAAAKRWSKANLTEMLMSPPRKGHLLSAHGSYR